jgi:hypothetical protein
MLHRSQPLPLGRRSPLPDQNRHSEGLRPAVAVRRHASLVLRKRALRGVGAAWLRGLEPQGRQRGPDGLLPVVLMSDADAEAFRKRWVTNGPTRS